MLVMLALIGTAYISTARIDRVATHQHASNTQIDLLVQGVIDVTKGTIVADLFDSNGTYRSGATYDHWDCPTSDPTLGDSEPNDAWLADRAPTVADTSLSASAPPPSGTNPPTWNAVSWPLIRNGSSANPYQFDLPNSATPRTLNLPKHALAPTSITVNSQTYPALEDLTDSAIFLAADADGDGIADAGLFKLPVGPIDGVTYYAGVRIVDNNSCLNANTAYSNASDFDGDGVAKDALGQAQVSGRTNLGIFPSHVDLENILASASEMDNLNSYRWGGFYPSGVRGSSAPSNPIDDGGNARTDFQFNTRGDAMWMQLGRRLDNPGYNTVAVKYKALPVGDSAALAYRFMLRNPLASSSLIESLMPGSLLNGTPFSPYGSGAAIAWYNANFNYDAGTYSLRPLMVIRNPVSNLIQPKYAPATISVANGTSAPTTVSTDWNGDGIANDPIVTTAPDPNSSPSGMAAFRSNPCKTSANTATFDELWRAYWNIMCGNPTDQTPFGAAAPATWNPYMLPNPQRMFRSSLRCIRNSYDAQTSRFAPMDEMLLRAAIAAANTIDLRDSDDDVSSFTLPINLSGDDGLNNSHPRGCVVTVYGCEKQIYITEIFVQTDIKNGTKNPGGYVAIELHNPNSTAISLKNWKLALIQMTASAYGKSNTNITTLADFGDTTPFPTPPSVPANGYLVLENYNPTNPKNDDATYRPNSAKFASPLPANTSIQYVSDLQLLLKSGVEMMLLRPRRADGTLTSGADGNGVQYKEAQNQYDMVPVDQFDFTNYEQHSPSSTSASVYHYVRANGAGNSGKCVYPGRYDPARAWPYLRAEGAAAIVYDPSGGLTSDPWYTTGPNPPVNLGGPDAAASYVNNFPAIQINPAGAGPNKINASGNAFPFGGFARNGDLLQIPYIGAYAMGVRQDNGNLKLKNFLTINSISMDSTFADDCDGGSNDAKEHVGHFCPMLTATDYYSWSANLFDYLTVLCPGDDYFPNTDASQSLATSPANPLVNKYTPTDANSAAAPRAVANVNPLVVNALGTNIPAGANEDKVPIEGLININTAPWRVLAALPMSADATQNATLAKAIVSYRNTNGPFRSIYELNKVPIKNSTGTILYYFKDAWWQPGTRFDADDSDGDFSPAGQSAAANDGKLDGVIADAEEEFLMVNRISNLITVRSDSFTCYIVVQGWRNAGTSSAELVTERRAAFIADRSGITATNKFLKTFNVPTN